MIVRANRENSMTTFKKVVKLRKESFARAKAEEKLQKVLDQLSSAIIEVGGKVSGKERMGV